MANITNKFLNDNKRYSEAVVVTVPSILTQGGGRSNADPIYIQGGEALTAQVVEADTIITKAYLIIDEAFPASAVINVDIAGTQYFVAADGTTTGMVVSTEEDNYLANSQTVTVSVAGITGDVTTGKARLVLATVHPTLKNGQYAN